MWIDRLMASPTTRAVELSAAFAEERQRVLAENLANVDTPDYQTKILDPRAFQKSLRAALDQAAGANDGRLELRGNAQCATGPDGRVAVRPASEPAPNVLFHDGTNAQLEQLLADVNENALFYEMNTNFLRSRYQTMLMAIRGRAT
jgi:flagellar basal-body rod protein FlgB